MKDATERYKKMVATVPAEIKVEVDLSFKISNRIAQLMDARQLTRKQLADALNKRPCEVTKWLSGQHNFTIATIAKLSTFFNQPIISVG
jgi:ribosome-binding protein aMBF1 (putative translation factor)